jgi:hypothetical protein
MKKYQNNIFFLIVSTIVLLSACKKQETRINYTGGTPPVLTSNTISGGDTLVLASADSANNLLALSWTNPNYTFTDGLSSQNVNYYIEFDTVGENFSGTVGTISINTSLNTILTEGAVNSVLLSQLQLAFDQPHNIEMRVESFLSLNAVPLYSNVFNYVITPYPAAKVALPTTGALYLVGDAGTSAVPAFTNWTNSAPGTGQQFKQISPTEYQITIAMAGGIPTDNPTGGAKNNEFLFVPQIGDWSNKYQAPNNANEASGGAFIYNGNATTGNGNFYGPTVAGTYLIDVNFQTGVYTITKQ